MSRGLRKRLWLPAVLIVVTTILLCCALPWVSERSPGGQQRILIDGQERTYFLHLPPGSRDGPVPLVLVFHGGGGDGKGMEGITGFSALADQEGFVVAYPDGVDHRWRSQPETTPEDQAVNDVGFVSALIDTLAQTYGIDKGQVYAAGISNGAVFSHRLACELPNKIAAIAAVAGTLSVAQSQQCNPSRPVPVLQFHGTEDTIIKYDGGAVRSVTNSEEVLSVAQTIAFWHAQNNCSMVEQRRQIPRASAAETTWAEQVVTGPCPAGAQVVLYTIHGGGHTWPGGAQYLPEALIGKTNRDLNATGIIWEFFTSHPMP